MVGDTGFEPVTSSVSNRRDSVCDSWIRGDARSWRWVWIGLVWWAAVLYCCTVRTDSWRHDRGLLDVRVFAYVDPAFLVRELSHPRRIVIGMDAHNVSSGDRNRVSVTREAVVDGRVFWLHLEHADDMIAVVEMRIGDC